MEKKKSSKSPPKMSRQISDIEYNDETTENKVTITSLGKIKKSLSQKSSLDSIVNEINSNTISARCDKCDKCSLIRENINKALTHVRSYVDTINDRINLVYHKTGSVKKLSSSSLDFESTISPDYSHAIYYAELDKIKIGSKLLTEFRFLMKSLRLFNDKFEYITKKHENFEKIAQEYKNYKLSNKLEEVNQLSETELNEVKSLNEQSIFKNFNIARECFENSLRELRNSLNGNNDRLTNNVDNKLLESSVDLNLEAKLGDYKETYLKNELARLVKENTSLRLEMNYIYEKLREDNKIYEIKEESLVKRSSSIVNRENMNSNNSPDTKRKSKNLSYSSGNSAVASSSGGGSLVVFKLKNDKKDEDYLIAKNYIKMLKQSEFYMI